MTSFASYILCTTPRSGSTLLCGLLRDTGCAGDPQSYFHQPSLANWCGGLKLPLGSSISKIFTEARRVGSGNSDLFGLRMQRHSFDFWMAQLAKLHPSQTSDLGRIEAAFGRTAFIHLTRTDKIAQAVSLVRATQSGLWHRNADGSELERLSTPQNLRYDHAAIGQQLDELTVFEDQWKTWFRHAGITPLTISYEALAADPTATLNDVFIHLRLDQTRVQNAAPPTAKLADDINLQWAHRFATEIA
jgi:LPS sulfotransferase NodH